MATLFKAPLAHIIAWSIVLAALVTTFCAFGPPVMGGKTSMLAVTGNSMEPHFHAGDLVFVREEAHYDVGDGPCTGTPISDGEFIAS